MSSFIIITSIAGFAYFIESIFGFGGTIIFLGLAGFFIEFDPKMILSAPYLKNKSASFNCLIPPPTDNGTKQLVEKKLINSKNLFENFFSDISIKINSSILQRSIKFFVYL